MDDKVIIYWKGDGPEQSTLLSLFHKKNIPVVLKHHYQEVLDSIAVTTPIAVIVDCSATEEETSARIIELYTASPLFEIPTFVFGKKVVSRSSVLARQFNNFQAFDVPIATEKVLNIILELTKTLIPAETTAAPKNDPSKLVATLGGELLSGANSAAVFDDSILVPPGPKQQILLNALKEITTKSEWHGVHARRVAFVSSAISNQLGFGPDRDKNIRTVGLLFNYGLKDPRSPLAKADILTDLNPQQIKDLAGSLQVGASLAKDQMNDDIAARTLNVISELLLKRTVKENYAVTRDAEIALATEIADRACWARGNWDPRAVYRVLDELGNKRQFTFDGETIRSLGRILTEAVVSRKTLLNQIPPITGEKADAEKRQVEKAEQEAEKLFGVVGLRSIALFELRSGMRLARPVVSADGKVILPADVSLDDDLILRLWKIAAIRPLKVPLFVAISLSGKKKR